MKSKSIGLIGALVFSLMLFGAGFAQAQAVQYINSACSFSWTPNTESDLAGYKAFAVQGAVQKPIVTILKPASSTSCAALGVTADGLWTFNVLAYDLAGNASNPSTIQVTRDTIAPASPANPSVSSPQPIALTVTPNPDKKIATVAWIPGTCSGLRTVKRLVSGVWKTVGTTAFDYLEVPLVNQASQPYGVSAICEG